ncbi:hypothetical protein CAPTEDRAFT_218845 [Capitella teleta]|uniref:MARVEL domain-containing protein n=1 Tax=Capitella teleta TaxID=283909 RepID=R7TJQ7_CAPTE|nr:hypothetical protein CAPTEDRAFT_218845 [Capitella teleta]|eukprot:ELT93944.1 hypothetical protein CAPTEDRAFT_218845 [Capitella teleta]
MPESTSCSAVVAATFAVLLFAIAFSTPFWTLIEVGTAKTFSGIWYGCASVDGAVTCEESVTPSSPDWIRAVQVLQILAMLLGLAGFIVTIVWGCRPYRRALAWAIFALFLIGLFFGIASLGTFAANAANESYSFFVSAAGCLLYFITAIIAVIGACNMNDNRVSGIPSQPHPLGPSLGPAPPPIESAPRKPEADGQMKYPSWVYSWGPQGPQLESNTSKSGGVTG